MDPIECIRYAAQAEAASFRSLPLPDDDCLDHNMRAAVQEAAGGVPVPFFTLRREKVLGCSHGQDVGVRKYVVKGYAHEGHDNEPRMPFVLSFLQERVLPFIDPRIDVSGVYPIELHDSYSYLPRSREYRNCLTFSRRLSGSDRQAGLALLPDPFQMGNYGGAFDAESDKVPWDQKRDSVYFVGSTTGSRDPARNVRVQAALYAARELRGQNVTLKLSHVVQMDEATLNGYLHADVSSDSKLNLNLNLKDLSCPAAPLEDNYQHRYLLNLPGNTCAWSRVPMILASKSLMLDLRPSPATQAFERDVEWYYPFLQDGTHFVGCTLESLASKHAFAVANPQVTQYIIANANRFQTSFLGANQAALYTRDLLEAIASASAR